MVPCQRKTSTQGKTRRSHDALKPAHAVRCPNCRAWKLPHGACTGCGYVRPGLQLVVSKED